MYEKGTNEKGGRNTKVHKRIPDEMKENGCAAVVFSDSELMAKLEYYYEKSTLEIKHFRNKRVYENISEEVDLYYKGRILIEQNRSKRHV